jgi:hypothetical protein
MQRFDVLELGRAGFVAASATKSAYHHGRIIRERPSGAQTNPHTFLPPLHALMQATGAMYIPPALVPSSCLAIRLTTFTRSGQSSLECARAEISSCYVLIC